MHHILHIKANIPNMQKLILVNTNLVFLQLEHDLKLFRYIMILYNPVQNCSNRTVVSHGYLTRDRNPQGFRLYSC